MPTAIESLTALRPVQIVGGEQTLFAVTADGKVNPFCFLPVIISLFAMICIFIHSFHKYSFHICFFVVQLEKGGGPGATEVIFCLGHT